MRRRLLMPVRVDELTTDVTVEEAGAGGGGGGSGRGESEPQWARLEAARNLAERLGRDAERTRAEAYSD
jgi:hypothetical protein